METLAVIKDLTTIILTAVSVISIISVLRYQVNRNEAENKENNKKTSEKIDNLVGNLNALLIDIKGFSREQAIVNKFFSDTLASINNKVEQVEQKVVENEKLMAILKELTEEIGRLNDK